MASVQAITWTKNDAREKLWIAKFPSKYPDIDIGVLYVTVIPGFVII